MKSNIKNVNIGLVASAMMAPASSCVDQQSHFPELAGCCFVRDPGRTTQSVWNESMRMSLRSRPRTARCCSASMPQSRHSGSNTESQFVASHFLQAMICALATSFAMALVPGGAHAEDIIYNFPGFQQPEASLVEGTNGNFYGTTYAGGDSGLGSVFELTPGGTVTTLVSFTAANGGHPYAGLTRSTNGDSYGTTYDGGNLALNNGAGLGTVFKLTAAGALTTLVTFNATNGGFPYAGLTLGSDGNFYGSTFWGGNLALNNGGGYGTVFKMTSEGVLTTLVKFNGANGANPGAAVVEGNDGNFYGTTYAGGLNNLGTVFKMTPGGGVTTLVSFNASNGGHPTAGLIQGGDGNFYGTTYWGGNLALNGGNGYGTVFEITSSGALTTLVQFSASNGEHPYAGLIQGADGNFFGTTQSGGDLSLNSGNGYGTAFQIDPDGTLTTLISFTGDNGAFPYAGLLQATDGNFYGATSSGGSGGGGTIFRFNTASPLVFTQQPGDRSVSLGASARFQAIALGNVPLACQWYFNDTALLTATNPILTISNVQLTNAGNYMVIATNFSGSVTSRLATLQVDPTFTKITTGDIVTLLGTGGSCAWGDYDNDGYIDLIVTSAHNSATSTAQKNILYHNNRDGTFTSISNTVITSIAQDWRGCSWVDYDNDGFVDLIAVANDADGFAGGDYLFHNNGDETFSSKTTSNTSGAFAPVANESEGPVWADYDRDGFVDLYIAKYGTDWFYHNNADGTFTRLANATVGLVADNRDSYNAMWADYDNDGWPDLFVGVKDDSGQNQTNFLYRNQRNGTFARVLSGSIATDNDYSIACVWGDYDNDGYPDLFLTSGVTRNGTNVLYHNNGDGAFTRMSSAEVGSLVSDVSWFTQAAWGDYDNDGYLDLFVTSDAPYSVNYLYHNNGDGTFTRVLTGSLANDAGLSYGCTWGDYDNDGFLDLFVARGSDAAPSFNLLYRNNGNSNSWITVKLVGTVSNRSAIGAKVRVQATIHGKTFWQLREVNTGDGYCANQLDPHFGLGDATNIDTLRIEWPSGMVQEFHDVAPKQILTITEPPRLIATLTNGFPQFLLKGGRGFQYIIDSSSDLSTWSFLGTVIVTNFDGMAAIVDPNPPTANRFYRGRKFGEGSGGVTGDDADIEAVRSSENPPAVRIKAAQAFAAYNFSNKAQIPALFPFGLVGEALSIAYELDPTDPITMADMNYLAYLNFLAFGP